MYCTSQMRKINILFPQKLLKISFFKSILHLIYNIERQETQGEGGVDVWQRLPNQENCSFLIHLKKYATLIYFLQSVPWVLGGQFTEKYV